MRDVSGALTVCCWLHQRKRRRAGVLRRGLSCCPLAGFTSGQGQDPRRRVEPRLGHPADEAATAIYAQCPNMSWSMSFRPCAAAPLFQLARCLLLPPAPACVLRTQDLPRDPGAPTGGRSKATWHRAQPRVQRPSNQCASKCQTAQKTRGASKHRTFAPRACSFPPPSHDRLLLLVVAAGCRRRPPGRLSSSSSMSPLTRAAPRRPKPHRTVVRCNRTRQSARRFHDPRPTATQEKRIVRSKPGVPCSVPSFPSQLHAERRRPEWRLVAFATSTYIQRILDGPGLGPRGQFYRLGGFFSPSEGAHSIAEITQHRMAFNSGIETHCKGPLWSSGLGSRSGPSFGEAWGQRSEASAQGSHGRPRMAGPLLVRVAVGLQHA